MMLYGMVFVCVAWGVHVIVWFACELLRAAVWCSLVVVFVCVRFVCLRALGGVLCDVVGFVVVVDAICVGVLIVCLLDVFMMYCVMVYDLCLCCVESMRVGFNVIVRFACELLRAVVWCSLVVVLVCVRVVCLRVLRDVLCDGVGFVFVVAFLCVGSLIICLLGVFMMYVVMVSGLCLCCFEIMRVGFNVFVRVVCDLLCDVV